MIYSVILPHPYNYSLNHIFQSVFSLRERAGRNIEDGRMEKRDERNTKKNVPRAVHTVVFYLLSVQVENGG